MSEQLKQQIFLLPEEIESGENVRPGLTQEEHERRVKALVQAIREEGQIQPVIVKEVEKDNEIQYQTIDGEGRRQAIASINEKLKGDEKLKVWCVIDDGSGDAFRKAIMSNVIRTDNNPITMALLFETVRKRQKWTGSKSTAKVASYFGVSEATVTEHEKFLTAPDDIRAKLESGELSAKAALLLLNPKKVAADKRKEVQARAEEIAQDEAIVVKKAKAEGKSSKEATGSKVRNAGKVQAKHVEKAAREVADAKVKRSRTEIVEFFTMQGDAVPVVQDFIDTFEKWCSGDIKTDGPLNKKWDALVEPHLPKEDAKPKGKK